MTRTELETKAEGYRKLAAKATTESDRNVLLRKARDYYQEAGLTGMAAWCERFLG